MRKLLYTVVRAIDCCEGVVITCFEVVVRVILYTSVLLVLS